jgi:thiol-disulfide isomerase/thioredoxin
MKRNALCLLALYLWALPASADPLDLSKYRGKVVYLDFWASWCTPCHLSFPWMNDMQQAYSGEGLTVIAVDLDRDRHAADEFLAENRGNLNILYDPKGEIARQFNFKDMPTAILVGRDGRIRATHSGFVANQEGAYLADVERLLREKTP